MHIAGSHLEDPKTGEFNLPFIRKEFPDEDFSVVTFARWEEGLVVAPANPKGIREDRGSGAQNVRFVNREPGSGSRALLDKLPRAKPASMRRAGPRATIASPTAIWRRPTAWCRGDADVCLATRSAAQTFGLGFHSAAQRTLRPGDAQRALALPAVKAFLDVLQRATLRRKLEVLAGYDTSETGVQLV